MKARLILSVLCMTMFISLSAQTSTSTLKEAKELKDGGNYLEAAKKYSESRTANLVGKQLLDVLAPEAECYYMLDDYQQLDSTIVNYIKCFRASREELGDSLDVYKAYLFKMLGNALYAEVDESSHGIDYAKKASDYYDYIIIDSPPINIVTDVAVMADFISGVIYVARYGSTTTDDLKKSKLALEKVNAKLLGLVTAGVESKKSLYVKGKGSYYYYYTSKDEE